MGGSQGKNIHLFSAKTPVTFGSTYGVRAYTDSQKLQSGEAGFYLDEYNANGDWISGKWLGAIYDKNVIDKAYAYTPSSPDVASVRIQIYMVAGSVGQVFIDNVELFVR